MAAETTEKDCLHSEILMGCPSCILQYVRRLHAESQKALADAMKEAKAAQAEAALIQANNGDYLKIRELAELVVSATDIGVGNKERAARCLEMEAELQKACEELKSSSDPKVWDDSVAKVHAYWTARKGYTQRDEPDSSGAPLHFIPAPAIQRRGAMILPPFSDRTAIPCSEDFALDLYNGWKLCIEWGWDRRRELGPSDRTALPKMPAGRTWDDRFCGVPSFAKLTPSWAAPHDDDDDDDTAVTSSPDPSLEGTAASASPTLDEIAIRQLRNPRFAANPKLDVEGQRKLFANDSRLFNYAPLLLRYYAVNNTTADPDKRRRRFANLQIENINKKFAQLLESGDDKNEAAPAPEPAVIDEPQMGDDSMMERDQKQDDK
ncbi:hypothetical protein BST61_g10200 [Cercospora zeina]